MPGLTAAGIQAAIGPDGSGGGEVEVELVGVAGVFLFFLFCFCVVSCVFVCALWVTCLVDGLVVFFGWRVLVLFAVFCFCLGGFGT